MHAFKPIIAQVAAGQALNEAEAVHAFDLLTSGEATASQIGAFLMALRVRGETVDELAGAALAMRRRMIPVSAPEHAIDVVGTGGDNAGTFNISTAAALVTAAAGVPIAKHGNRALSSLSGAADVLSALGVRLDINADQVSRCIREAGIGFMFAPNHHPALRAVAATRVELGTRTLFNLLGPLINPAGVRRHLIGVYDKAWLAPVAETLRRLGSQRALIVHGADGLDELTLSGPTHIAELAHGDIHLDVITPQDAGLEPVPTSALRGGDPAVNARALRDLLDGAPGPYRDAVCLNAAAALRVAGAVDDLVSGVSLARQLIDDGAARDTLHRLATTSMAMGDHD